PAEGECGGGRSLAVACGGGRCRNQTAGGGSGGGCLPHNSGSGADRARGGGGGDARGIVSDGNRCAGEKRIAAGRGSFAQPSRSGRRTHAIDTGATGNRDREGGFVAIDRDRSG